MRSVGVRELKQHTSRILREVREQGEIVEITYRGRVMARLVPERQVLSATEREKLVAVWADMDQLAAEIGKHWPTGVSAVEAVREQRREL
ncbi:MAG TPA: type II toxin-antitoxin system prevent-host-death family antitoxin [Chloroflexota bacterium]|nr:type II toxin-antitoxin system prevent-host-death family antitoxin [Chloroflexota bacterium]